MIRMPWRKAASGLVGIQVGDEGIALAYSNGNHTANANNARPSLEGCEWLRASPENDLREQLKDRIEHLRLDGRICNAVLASGRYSLMLVEAPNVPTEELRDAVSFRIRDMIAWPLEKAVIDVFALPDDSSRSGRKMVYAVAAEREQIEQLIELVDYVGLQLNAIDISELAQRNLLENLQQGSRGIAGVQLLHGRGSVSLLRDGQLYLTRQFELDYNAGLLDEIPTAKLVLELQRSLDYYERQMGQAPPDSIFLFGENVSEDKITDELRSGLTAKVSGLPITTLLDLPASTEPAMLQLCADAIGGTLRQSQFA